MVETEVRVVSELGHPARAAARLVKLASTFDCSISLYSEARDAKADARSILDVMFLAAGRGSRLRIAADGKDEGKALAAITDLFANGFKEL